jgi:DNA-binding response OmpR family regulator
MAALQRHVLIVDDDPDVSGMLTTALRQRSLEIDVAGGGGAAIELLTANEYAVVLLDIMMPNVDGFAVLDALRTRNAEPVVLVVSGADRTVLDRLDTTQIHGIVRKPFDPQELATLVAACAEMRGRANLEAMVIATMATAPLFTLIK